MRRKKPAKLTLSPTKISTYLACRVMYKYSYIDRIGRFYYRPRAYHSFGASLHRTLEDFHAHGGAEARSPEELVDRLHELWTSSGYVSAQEEEERMGEAEQMLQVYHVEHRVEGVKTLFAEKVLKQDMGEFNLMGRIDRIDEHPGGHLEVIDYKSGRMSVDEEDVRSDLAMGIYAYLTHLAHPDRELTATIYCLRSGVKATVGFDREELAEVEEGVRAVAEDIAHIDEDSIIEPVWLPYVCPECDYLRLCARTMGWDVDELMREAGE